MAHTPGPWMHRGKLIYANGSVDTIAVPVLGVIASVEETEATDIDGRNWSVSGDALDNARLIAAAPDMADALKALRDAVISSAPAADLCAALFKAESALNRALGES